MISGVTWPLFMNEIRGNSNNNTFGMVRKYPNGNPKAHQGWDFYAAVGSRLYAIADGKIMFVKNIGDYGLQICQSFVAAGVTRYAFYAHLGSSLVTAGANVVLNQEIGTTGKSGNAVNLAASEMHLHFEIRTIESPGLGLGGRVSPLQIYGVCPLSGPIPG